MSSSCENVFPKKDEIRNIKTIVPICLEGFNVIKRQIFY